jgi:hypothetical protein
MADLRVAVTCPSCGAVSEATMPIDRCVLAYDCAACQAVLTRRPGDCCVFCSYGDRRCPFVQDAISCPEALLP